jgi:hypothetical protein
MARIKIKDLPKDQKISKEEMKKVHGGGWISWLWTDNPDAPSVKCPAGGADSWPKFK